MRWKRGRRSSNIEDRRGARPRTGLPNLFPGRLGGTAPGRPRGRGSLVVTVLVLLGLYFLGVDPRLLLQSDSISVGPGSRIPGADSGAAPAARSRRVAASTSRTKIRSGHSSPCTARVISCSSGETGRTARA